MMKDVIEYNERVCREFVESQKNLPKCARESLYEFERIMREGGIKSHANDLGLLGTLASHHTEHKTSQ